MVANIVLTVANQATPSQATAVYVQKPVPIQQPLAVLAIMHPILARSNAVPAQDINVQLAAHPIT